MNVIVGIRELRMSHIRAQVRKHSIQILAITHPMIQPVGCKSVPKLVEAENRVLLVVAESRICYNADRLWFCRSLFLHEREDYAWHEKPEASSCNAACRRSCPCVDMRPTRNELFFFNKKQGHDTSKWGIMSLLYFTLRCATGRSRSAPGCRMRWGRRSCRWCRWRFRF